jgi:hypothetical protein
MPNTKGNNGEGQRNKVYYVERAAMGKGGIAFQPFFPWKRKGMHFNPLYPL